MRTDSLTALTAAPLQPTFPPAHKHISDFNHSVSPLQVSVDNSKSKSILIFIPYPQPRPHRLPSSAFRSPPTASQSRTKLGITRLEPNSFLATATSSPLPGTHEVRDYSGASIRPDHTSNITCTFDNTEAGYKRRHSSGGQNRILGDTAFKHT